MAGSHSTLSDGGSNYLCLPLNPIYEKVTGGNQGSNYIYGTEYKVSDQTNIFQNSNLHDQHAPCAVCNTESRGSHMMIPARNVCSSGWTMEYKGYLMSEHFGHKGELSSYVLMEMPKQHTDLKLARMDPHSTLLKVIAVLFLAHLTSKVMN